MTVDQMDRLEVRENMNLIKNLKKAITLLELVVSIAISTVIFVGVVGLMFYLRNTNDTIKNDTSNFFVANSLCHALENELDNNNYNLANLPITRTEFGGNIQAEVVGVDNTVPILFSVVEDGNTLKNYYFYNQHFGYTTETSLLFNNIYFTNSNIKLIVEPSDKNTYVLKFQYESDFSKEITLTKLLYGGAR